MGIDTGIIVTTFEGASEEFTKMNKRLEVVEETSDVILKIWGFLKYMTPIMIGTLLAGVSHDSLLYKIVAYLMDPTK